MSFFSHLLIEVVFCWWYNNVTACNRVNYFMSIKFYTILIIVVVVLMCFSGVSVDAASVTTIRNFSGRMLDGLSPYGNLVFYNSRFYGVTGQGGPYNNGAIFSVNVDGSNFTILHNFNVSDGSQPQGSLILSGNTLYGTTSTGGDFGGGVIFSYVPNTNTFNSLYSFDYGLNGYQLQGDLVSSGSGVGLKLYGTASFGGNPSCLFGNGCGTIYSFEPATSTFALLHSFDGTNGNFPNGSLIISGNTLYGTTQYGGASGNGTIFSVDTGGGSFTLLYSFTAGNDGSNPQNALTFSADGLTLYGTTQYGGANGNGTIFSISTIGQNFSVLYSFIKGTDGGNLLLMPIT